MEPGAPTTGESKTGLYVAIIFGVVVFAGMGWYVFSATNRKTTGNLADPNDPLNEDIPGLPKTKKGDKAIGVLTDPNFFNGLANLANTFSGIAKDWKTGAANTSGTGATGGATVASGPTASGSGGVPSWAQPQYPGAYADTGKNKWRRMA